MSLLTTPKRLSAALLALLLSLPSTLPAAGTAGKLVIVLDASASMWGKIDGSDKISLVRKGLPGLLDKQPDGTQFGLVAFGSKEKLGCSDVATVIKPGELGNAAFLKKTAALKLGGKSPIAAALEQAATLVSAQDAILLISDGIDECNADPCAAAQALKEKHPDLRIHVLSFPSLAATGQLRCIADKTGGNFALVSEADKLPSLMASLPTKTGNNKPVPANTPGNLQLSSSGNHQTTKLAANYLIYDHNGNPVANFTARTGITQALPAGNYEVSTLWGAAKRTQKLSISAGQTTAYNFDFGATGTLALEAKDDGGKPVTASFSVYTEAGDYVADHLFKAQMAQQVPVGIYRVKATVGGQSQETLITVKPNAQNAHLFEFRRIP